MRKFYPLYLILAIEIIQSGSGMPDCDHDQITTNILDVCKVYTEYQSFKRETKDANGFRRIWSDAPTEKPKYQNPTSADDGQQTLSLTNLLRQWTLNRNLYPSSPTFESFVNQHPHRKNDFHAVDTPNEPEDFAWYLNPVYASVEWQSPIERWTRAGQKAKEIDNFIKKCCNTGCPFPEAYFELETKLNIC
ncbi:hypothetical protein Ocin01_09137 [Orchesella cincta]|uniref:Uncharacterized protein n=1 Tax=Orchesella cincta TaxID=48709 RepID=A0A1D2MWV7_ORCCI|nr:hypothetical protein Ocin01_09137 [Orchesella cincta]